MQPENHPQPNQTPQSSNKISPPRPKFFLKPMFSIWGICGLVALILWLVALFLPAYYTKNILYDGSVSGPSSIRTGLDCFLFGLFLLPLWLPNLFLFAFVFKHLLTSSTSLAKSHWSIMARIFVVAITLTPIVLALLAVFTLKDIPNGDVMSRVMSIGLGAYLWLGSIVIASVATMIRALRRP